MLLNEAKTPPFQIAEDAPVSEDVRLRYRYLDLRRPRLQHNIGLRHRVSMAIRQYFDANGFWEIETPILAKSTPEGARDFLVPSRVHPGEFYALPQSPQIFKQILMIAGTDRYFQIVRCFRDEDQRADRQLEFTQVDVEMSFARAGDDLRPDRAADAGDLQGDRPRRDDCRSAACRTPRRSRATARTSRTCAPGMEIHDLSEVFRDSEFRVFKQIVADGGVVRGFAVPGGNKYSRSQLDVLVDQAKQMGFTGLIWVRPGRTAAELGEGARAKATLRPALERAGAAADDLLLMAAGKADETSKLLGQLRLAIAKKENLLKPGRVRVSLGHRLSAARIPRRGRPLVFDAPPVHLAARRGHRQARERPGRGPRQGLRPGAERLAKSAAAASESTTRRCRRASSSALGITDEEAKLRFGFFLEALEYGTPPHGGIALGLDRIVAMLAGEASIREVIAFPKTANAVDLMAGAPSPVGSETVARAPFEDPELS